MHGAIRRNANIKIRSKITNVYAYLLDDTLDNVELVARNNDLLAFIQ